MAQTGKDKDTKQSKLKIIWFFLKPYKLCVFGLFVLAAVIGVLETATVAAIYPMVSLGYVISAIAAYFWLGEHVTLIRMTGIFIILFGVYLVARS